MNLAIDIGNTRVKTGIFRNNKLLKNNSFDTFDLKTLKSIFNENPGIENVILCGVKKYPAEWKKFLSTHSNFYELTASSLTPYSLPLKIAYKTPETLGMDRLATVYGAYSICGKVNILVINAGTCITYDFLDKKGVYKGGSISPGVDMRFKALHTFTAQLPLLELDMNFKKITGTTTYQSIQAGVQQGIIKEVEGMIKAYQSAYPGLIVMLTGGSMPWLLKSIKMKIKAEPLLSLTGLNVILEFFLK